LSNKEKAQRYTRLAGDEVFQELLQDVRDDAVSVFLEQSRDDEAIHRARNLIDALNTIETKINSIKMDDLVDEKRKSAPWKRLKT
jgi:nucleoside diphosphate kinase